ncbi:MAG: hypothetical protein VXY63_04195 [Pseudomonadota bacterium]|nr:hypothetical protein [Pseudomonadota bacterium]
MSPIHVADSVRIALGTDTDCQALADALGQTALPSNYTDIMTRLESGEDCASKQFAWDGHVLPGDMDSANQIASELWDKGSRGLALAFMAKQLGIPHPPGGR